MKLKIKKVEQSPNLLFIVYLKLIYADRVLAQHSITGGKLIIGCAGRNIIRACRQTNTCVQYQWIIDG